MTLSRQWRVDELVAESDLHDKNGDDTAVRSAWFDLPIEQLSFVDRPGAASWCVATAHEPLPAATVCYVGSAAARRHGPSPTPSRAHPVT